MSETLKSYNEDKERVYEEVEVDVCDESMDEGDENPREEKKLNVSKWSNVDGKIIPVSDTIDKLEPGYYSIGTSQSVGLYFEKNKIELNKLYRLPNDATDIVMNDIDKFWTLEDKYKKYNRVFRRNYLLYSAPGTGKTSLINLMCKDLIEKYNGIVISLTNEHELSIYVDAMRILRRVEPKRRVITIIEDIDNFVGQSSSLDTYLLNILDGNMKTSGVVTIATTNYIEKMESRYKNRPSRFNRVIEFPLPNEESRRVFIENSILKEDLERIDLDKWVRETEGYTIDHINELIQLVLVFDEDEDESFNLLNNMVEKNSKLKNETSVNIKKMGF